jgi:hypothetical protein
LNRTIVTVLNRGYGTVKHDAECRKELATRVNFAQPEYEQYASLRVHVSLTVS